MPESGMEPLIDSLPDCTLCGHPNADHSVLIGCTVEECPCELGPLT